MTPPSEFPRPLALDRLGSAGHEETVSATAAECAALAVRLGIPALHALTCRWRLRRSSGGRIEADGLLEASLVRECVITLDAFEMRTRESFNVVFVPAGSETEDPDPEAVDEIPYDGSVIDLGEAAAEQLALTLDPYPHKPGAALPALDEPEPPATRPSPFAVLGRRAKDS